jgi:hypothetical protein
MPAGERPNPTSALPPAASRRRLRPAKSSSRYVSCTPLATSRHRAAIALSHHPSHCFAVRRRLTAGKCHCFCRSHNRAISTVLSHSILDVFLPSSHSFQITFNSSHSLNHARKKRPFFLIKKALSFPSSISRHQRLIDNRQYGEQVPSVGLHGSGRCCPSPRPRRCQVGQAYSRGHGRLSYLQQTSRGGRR